MCTKDHRNTDQRYIIKINTVKVNKYCICLIDINDIIKNDIKENKML